MRLKLLLPLAALPLATLAQVTPLGTATPTSPPTAAPSQTPIRQANDTPEQPRN